MESPTSRRGASLHRRSQRPAVDLGTLVSCLVDALPPLTKGTEARPNTTAAYLRQLPLFSYFPTYHVLRLNFSAVLSRLSLSPKFEELRAGEYRGFLRDIAPPALGRAWVGGTLPEGGDVAMAEAVRALVREIDTAFKATCDEHNLDPSTLEQREMSGFWQGLAQRFHTEAWPQALRSTISPLKVADDLAHTTGSDGISSGEENGIALEAEALLDRDETAEPSEEMVLPVGRLFAIREQLRGDRDFHVSCLWQGIAETLRHTRQLSQAARDEIEEGWKQMAADPDSQLSQFLDFLSREALAGLRHQASITLMTALAKSAERRESTIPGRTSTILAETLKRASLAFHHCGGPEAKTIEITLGSRFGHGDFLLEEEWGRAHFFRCLPVWCEWGTQLFEEQALPTQPEAWTTRDIGIRFRWNGIVRFQQKSAYMSRLAKIQAALQRDAEQPHPRERRRLAELLLLVVVLPVEAVAASSPPPTEANAWWDVGGQPCWLSEELAAGPHLEHKVSIEGRIAWVQTLLEIQGRAGARQVLRWLSLFDDAWHEISALLQQLLRERQRLLSDAMRSPLSLSLSVSRALIDIDALLAGVSNPLRASTDSEKAKRDFQRYVSVRAVSENALALSSIPVRVSLRESLLTRRTNAEAWSLSHEAPTRGVVAFWKAFDAHAKGPWHPLPIGDLQRWSSPPCLVLEYSSRYTTSRPGRRNRDPHARACLLAAYRTGFALLAGVALERVAQYILGDEQEEEALLYLMRMQGQSRSRDDGGLASFLYSVTHALETTLGQSRKLACQGLAHDRPHSFEARARRAARQWGRPVSLSWPLPGSAPVEQVGILSFAARPCDTLSELEGHRKGGMLLTCRGYRLRLDAATQRATIDTDAWASDITTTSELEEQPALIVEQIRRLATSGCRHLLFFTRRFGERRVGRSESRWRFYDNPAFLDQLQIRFPDIVIYPLARDITQIVRLSPKNWSEDAFEMCGPEAHGVPVEAGTISGDYLPVYSLATFNLQGPRVQRPQSGLVTYFLRCDRQAASWSRVQRAVFNFTTPSVPVRDALFMALRAVHWLASEKPVVRGRLEPVLDAYPWIKPDSVEAHGECVVLGQSRRREASVVLNLRAVLHRTLTIVRDVTQSEGEGAN